MQFATLFRNMVGGALCVVALAGTPAAAQETKTVSIATTTTGMLYIPIYAAETLGYFEEEGISIEMQQMNSSAIMAAVIRGNVDIYPATPVGALRAASEGADVRIFGALMTQYASNVVLSGAKARELGLDENSTLEERMAALRGLNIAVTGAGSGTHQLALYLLQRAGLEPDRDATVVFVGGSREVLAAFQHERIDGFILSNPTSDTAIRDYGGFLLFNTAAGEIPELDGYPYITLDARGEWLSEDPERSVAFLRAINRALEAIKNPETTEAVRDQIHANYLNQFDKELFDAAWSNVNPAYPDNALVTEEMMLAAIEYLNDFSDETYDASLAATVLVDEYAQQALEGQ